jgi:hypothetical protein
MRCSDGKVKHIARYRPYDVARVTPGAASGQSVANPSISHRPPVLTIVTVTWSW